MSPSRRRGWGPRSARREGPRSRKRFVKVTRPQASLLLDSIGRVAQWRSSSRLTPWAFPCSMSDSAGCRRRRELSLRLSLDPAEAARERLPGASRRASSRRPGLACKAIDLGSSVGISHLSFQEVASAAAALASCAARASSRQTLTSPRVRCRIRRRFPPTRRAGSDVRSRSVVAGEHERARDRPMTAAARPGEAATAPLPALSARSRCTVITTAAAWHDQQVHERSRRAGNCTRSARARHVRAGARSSAWRRMLARPRAREEHGGRRTRSRRRDAQRRPGDGAPEKDVVLSFPYGRGGRA
jgi:hypothetical protein